MQIRTAGIGFLVGGLIATAGTFAVRLQEADEKVMASGTGKAALVCALVVVVAGVALIFNVNPPRLIAFGGLLVGLADVVLGILDYLDARDVQGDQAGGGPWLVALGGLMAVAIGVLSLRPPPSA